MKKILPIAVAAFLGMTAAANATMTDISLGNTSSDVAYSTGGSITGNIDLSTYGGLALSNAFVIAPPTSVTNQYKAPTGTLFGNSYLAVEGSPSTGSATFTLASGQHDFNFTWGSIDAFNTITLTDSRNVTYTITGSELLAQIVGSVAGTTQSDVAFTDTFGTIVNAQLTSTQNAFEAGNFSQSAIPLPAALPLFGAALMLGFVAFGRKKDETV